MFSNDPLKFETEEARKLFLSNPIWTRKKNLINGPRVDRFDTTQSNVINSQITKEKKSVFAPREVQFFEKIPKFFVIILATLIFN